MSNKSCGACVHCQGISGGLGLCAHPLPDIYLRVESCVVEITEGTDCPCFAPREVPEAVREAVERFAEDAYYDDAIDCYWEDKKHEDTRIIADYAIEHWDQLKGGE